jgi:DNA-binding winged helix-turn-helix (wHTH) protein
MSGQTRHFYAFGQFRLYPEEYLLARNGQAVPLPPRVFDTLALLVENSGHLIEKEDLMKRLWPDALVEEANLTNNISMLRKVLGETADEHYIETVPRRGYRFVALVSLEQEESGRESAATAGETIRDDLEPVGGAVPLDSEFYIARPTDHEFRAAIARRDSIVLVKGARQVGKTSLLARGLQEAREADARVVLTDFQKLTADYLESIESLLLAMAASFADQLDLDVFLDQTWNRRLTPTINFERYLRREVLQKSESAVVWGLDEVDRLFNCAFGGEIFGLFRSWHNERALNPAGHWRRLTLAIAYATEAHLFITDLNQSPFNVGTRLTLEDFTFDQVAELNHRYGSPLESDAEVARYFRLVGGHPYLVRRGLHEIATRGLTLDELESQADHDEGPFGDHLRRLYFSLTQDADLSGVVRGVLRGGPCPTPESFFRLRSAGLMTGDSARDARPRCQLYATYLEKHLL